MADLLKSTQLDNVAIELFIDKTFEPRKSRLNMFIIQSYNTKSNKFYFQYVIKQLVPPQDPKIEAEANELYHYIVSAISDYECYKCGAVAFKLAEYPTENEVITICEGGKKIGIPTA